MSYPRERKDNNEMARYNFDYCMTELAEHEGVSMDLQTPRESRDSNDIGNMVLFQDFVDLMPKISEVNAVSDEMRRVCSSFLHGSKKFCHGVQSLTTNTKTGPLLAHQEDAI